MVLDEDELGQRLKERILHLERTLAGPNPDARAAVRELLVEDGGDYLVMERLPRLGAAAAAPLRELMAETGHAPETRIMAALVGLEVGERVGVPELLRTVSEAGHLAELAALRLAAHHEAGVEAAVEAGLRSLDPSDEQRVVPYLQALQGLGVALARAERVRLAKSPAWQVRSALQDLFPR